MPSDILARTQSKQNSTTSEANCLYGSGMTARELTPHILRQGHKEGHFGMPGMRERAQKIGAHLDVWSRPGAGTEVELRIAARIAYASEPNGFWLGSCGDCGTAPKKGIPTDEKTSVSHLRTSGHVVRIANLHIEETAL